MVLFYLFIYSYKIWSLPLGFPTAVFLCVQVELKYRNGIFLFSVSMASEIPFPVCRSAAITTFFSNSVLVSLFYHQKPFYSQVWYIRVLISKLPAQSQPVLALYCPLEVDLISYPRYLFFPLPRLLERLWVLLAGCISSKMTFPLLFHLHRSFWLEKRH